MWATISRHDMANGHLRSILSLRFLFFVGVDKSTTERAWFFIRSDSNSNDGQGRSLTYCLLPLVSTPFPPTRCNWLFSSFIWMHTLSWAVFFFFFSFGFDGIYHKYITVTWSTMEGFNTEAFTLLGVAIAIIGLRTTARWIMVGPKGFQADDYLMMVACVSWTRTCPPFLSANQYGYRWCMGWKPVLRTWSVRGSWALPITRWRMNNEKICRLIRKSIVCV